MTPNQHIVASVYDSRPTEFTVLEVTDDGQFVKIIPSVTPVDASTQWVQPSTQWVKIDQIKVLRELTDEKRNELHPVLFIFPWNGKFRVITECGRSYMEFDEARQVAATWFDSNKNNP